MQIGFFQFLGADEFLRPAKKENGKPSSFKLGDFQVIVKPLGSIGSPDPLDQWGSVGVVINGLRRRDFLLTGLGLNGLYRRIRGYSSAPYIEG